LDRRIVGLGAALIALIIISASQTSPPVSHPASEVDAGDFADAEYTFPGGIKVGSASTSDVKLDVTGYSRLGVTKFGAGPTSVFGRIDYGGGGANNKFIIYGKDNGEILSLGANNQYDRLVIDAAGHVGVGTASPSSLLTLDDAAHPFINFETSGVEKASIGTGTNGNLVFYTGGVFGGSGSERVRIDNQGNVGVGTGVPESILHLKDAEPMIQLEHSDGSVVGIRYDVDDPGIQFRLGGVGAGDVKMIITPGGKVGIGMIPSVELEVAGDIRATNRLMAMTDVMIGGDEIFFNGDAGHLYIEGNTPSTQTLNLRNLDAGNRMDLRLMDGNLEVAGSVKLPGVASGSGGQYACIDASGNLYKSAGGCS